jgi:hypothetical protein
MSLHEKLMTHDDESLKVQEHWYWDSWVLLALSATCCFASGNLVIAELSYLGVGSIMYFSFGSLVVTLLYFYFTTRKP